ncbi:MAG: hypothetical protein NQU46_04040 [Methanolinea sp.]|nr:hypothetical protein [Methanolinea sp.]
MEKSPLLIALMVLVLAAAPAMAMTSDTLDITVSPDGRADIEFTYHLNWIEYISVYLRLVDPAAELKKALESNFGKPVQVVSVDSNRVRFSVDTFATVGTKEGKKTIRTPGLSFAEGEKILKSYWFAPFVTADLSPSVTRIRFPDGTTREFYDALEIPPQVISW